MSFVEVGALFGLLTVNCEMVLIFNEKQRLRSFLISCRKNSEKVFDVHSEKFFRMDTAVAYDQCLLGFECLLECL